MVKVYREKPEFEGAPLEAEIPEEVLEKAISNGWKVKQKAVPLETEEPKTEAVPLKSEEPKKTTKKKL